MIVRCRRALALTVALLALPAAAASAAGPVWGPGSPVGTLASTIPVFSSVDCTSPGNCVAVGYRQAFSSSDPTTALVAIQRNGAWGGSQTLTELPADAGSGAMTAFFAVDCTTATTCTAVGQYQASDGGTHALVVPVSISAAGATLGTPPAVTPPADTQTTASDRNERFSGVSCATACTAVGSYVDENGDAKAIAATSADWKETEVDAPAAADGPFQLESVSCPATGACGAVGLYTDSAAALIPWTTQLTGVVAGTPATIVLPAEAMPTSSTLGGLPGVNVIGFGEISCPTAGACTAAGAYPLSGTATKPAVVRIMDGAPGAPIALAVPTGDTFSAVTGISCSGATDCTVAGLSGNVATQKQVSVVGSEEGGTWSALTPLPVTGSSSNVITGLGCSIAQACSAAGVDVQQVGGGTPTGRSFFAASGPALSASGDTLPAGTVGKPYSASLMANGGAGTKTWSIDGALPAGLSLDGATGVITGTPTAAGSNGFTAKVTDAGPPAQTATANLSIAVAAAPTPTPTPSATPTPTVVPAKAKVSIKSAKAKGPKVTVVLACTGAQCAGQLKLTAKVKTSERRKAKAKSVTLGSTSYAISKGKRQTLKFTLSRKNQKLLKRLKKISAKLTVTPLGAKKAAATKTVKLKRPKAKKRK